MNWDEVAGKWEQFKGKAKQQWGKLTDDDLTKIKGKKDELLGKLRERYGYTVEKAQDEFDKFCNSCSCESDKRRSERPESPTRSSTL